MNKKSYRIADMVETIDHPGFFALLLVSLVVILLFFQVWDIVVPFYSKTAAQVFFYLWFFFGFLHLHRWGITGNTNTFFIRTFLPIIIFLSPYFISLSTGVVDLPFSPGEGSPLGVEPYFIYIAYVALFAVRLIPWPSVEESQVAKRP